MKLVVFAHTPPPHHGQSYMVKLLLDGLGGRSAGDSLRLFHVNARLSDEIADIGRAGSKKVFRLLRYIGQAIWFRFRHGADYFYYVPAPPLRSAIYRDWIVMACCRPFFRGTIYHWQAAGLGEWLEQQARPWQRMITEKLLGRPDLSMVLGEYCRADAARLASRHTVIVPNAIPDPCPDFATRIEPVRRERTRLRRQLASGEQSAEEARRGAVFHLVYLGLCFREKGLFDLLEAVRICVRQLRAEHSPFRLKLSVAGSFLLESERAQFLQALESDELRGVVEYRGFVGGAEKTELLREADCLLFPTYYSAESFGIVLAEAMAFGLHIVATRWRTIPEVLPPGYAGIVEPRSPEALARAIVTMITAEYDPTLRQRYLERFTAERYVENIRQALKLAEQ